MRTILMLTEFSTHGKTETIYNIDTEICNEDYTLDKLEDLYASFGEALQKAREVENNLKKKGAAV